MGCRRGFLGKEHLKKLWSGEPIFFWLLSTTGAEADPCYSPIFSLINLS